MSLPIQNNKIFKNIKDKMDRIKQVNQEKLQLRQYIIQ